MSGRDGIRRGEGFVLVQWPGHIKVKMETVRDIQAAGDNNQVRLSFITAGLSFFQRT